MRELKSGDLALIINDSVPEHIGKCVELVKLVQPQESYIPPVPYSGMVNNSADVSVWVVIGDVHSTTYGGDRIEGFCQKCPSNLMPLRGDFAPERQKSQEVPA